ncbi:PilT protein domain protein [Candidatus Glomeribacter gigasporarum BEG34]|uniref:PilT protein domain protein n=1 Tax=Candidatus Glomeribacter gigasporarum BEG34 TaxID=1070319 RepID=G2JBP0_9BURK|nr:type II toxin-antitoxin system VapC family toxin [Candidatus Glomeribacter gigasporarum]CCD30194.1 PilT protein domain protein [Candidatus Glomeribacter gigasporarum BEG34]
MNLLLDTNILLRAMNEPENLPSQAREEIKKALTIYVSAASIWEISIKTALGKLNVNIDRLVTNLRQMKVQELPVSWEHASYIRNLPPIHRDPFDRILVAQALSEPMRLLTSDHLLTQYSELVIAIN